jgi:polysaccharide export outer membrane protein
MFRVLFIAVLALLLGSCGGRAKLASSEAVSVVASGELPPPERSDLFSESRPYLVGPFDKLMIGVFGIPELSEREVQVDASGRVSFPLVGSFQAAGKTPNELAQDLENLLTGKYIRRPQVTVNLKETISQVVTVDGQVVRPGLYPVLGRMSLLRAVATAGGTAEFAKLEDVVIFRTVNGARYAGLYNLKAIRRGAYGDPEIFANDVVVVGESRARRLFRDALTVVPTLLSPLIILLQ